MRSSTAAELGKTADPRCARPRRPHFDGAVRGVDNAAKLGEYSVACALDDMLVTHCDGRIDQVAAQHPGASHRSLFVCARKPAIADNIGDWTAAIFRVSFMANFRHRREQQENTASGGRCVSAVTHRGVAGIQSAERAEKAERQLFAHSGRLASTWTYRIAAVDAHMGKKRTSRLKLCSKHDLPIPLHTYDGDAVVLSPVERLGQRAQSELPVVGRLSLGVVVAEQ